MHEQLRAPFLANSLADSPGSRRARLSKDSEDSSKPSIPREGSSFFDLRDASGDAGMGASMLSCTLTLANTCMGTGVLALPAAYAGAGLLGGSALCIAAACLAALSIFFLEAAAARCGLGRATMFGLCELVLPGSGVAVSLALLVNCLGSALSYIIVAADNVTESLPFVDRRIFILCSALYFAPLCYLKSMDSFRVVSLLCVACLLLAACTVLAFGIAPGLDPCGAAYDAASPPAPRGRLLGGQSGAASSAATASYEGSYEDGAAAPVHAAPAPPVASQYAALGSTALCGGPVKLLGNPAQLFLTLPLFINAFFCHQNAFAVLGCGACVDGMRLS